jgi:hypothetical protein
MSPRSPYSFPITTRIGARAVLDAQSPQLDNLHYTVVQSVSASAFLELRELVLNFIENLNQLAGPSKEEELIAMTCDLFRV